ncbi:hypothetical protein [Pleionea litopenaei]|uniref:Uncharacterized protein n=1 Tax=Pleionea litopenaei TaxID=3070815 RepID=A0AA51RSL8_9GAMM|nr:hypothetical protein [Pleionea sp. HL-JVS1]WMS86744.1 hypothetical protein Q9312_16100 [Pleionea sp. HL-JVS1]
MNIDFFSLLSSLLLPIGLNLLALVMTYQLWIRWTRKQGNSLLRSLICVCLNTLSIVIWCKTWGVEYGITFYCVVSALISLMIVFLLPSILGLNPSNQKINKSSNQSRNSNTRRFDGVNGRQIGQALVTFLLAGPWAFIISAILAALLVKLYWGERANSLVFAALMLPLLWAGVSSWLMSQPQRLKPFLWSVLLLITSTVSVWGVN